MTTSDPELPHDDVQPVRGPRPAHPPRPRRRPGPRRLAGHRQGHPPRPSRRGDPAWYAQASEAYTQLNSPWGRSEAYADQVDAQNGTATPLPLVLHDPYPARPTYRPLRLLPSRIVHGRPVRLLIRAAACSMLGLVVLRLIPGTAAAPADVAGLIWFFALTARSDLAPPPRR